MDKKNLYIFIKQLISALATIFQLKIFNFAKHKLSIKLRLGFHSITYDTFH